MQRTNTKLSLQDRLYIIQTVNALPIAQFEELCFTLNPPKGIVPANTASQGERSKALLDWVEGPTGPGLISLDEVLQALVPRIIQPKQAAQPKAFAVSGQMGDLSSSELEAIVQLLRQKTGDDSITLAFYTEGSIKLVLNGTPEGLEKLQELFDSGGLTEVLDDRPVEYVHSIESSSTEARKARLLQVLRDCAERSKLETVRALAIARARELARELDSALALVQTQTPNRARDLNLDLARTLALALVLAPARNLDRARELARDLNLALVRYRELNRDLDLDRAMNLVHARYLALARVLSLFVDIDFGYADLSGANLRGLDLRGVILEGADLKDADVTETLFGDNPGLTESAKQDLRRRGAIFQDPPSSDVPSLVLR